jgi:uncharacterized membrane protein
MIAAWSRLGAGLGILLLAGACSDRGRDQPSDTTTVANRPADSAARPATSAFRAIGNEPFWALEIDGSGLRYRTPDDQKGIWFSPVAPSRVADTLRWIAESGGATIDARIWPGECSDGMSDRVWTHTALVVFGGSAHRGCAERRDAGSGR